MKSTNNLSDVYLFPLFYMLSLCICHLLMNEFKSDGFLLQRISVIALCCMMIYVLPLLKYPVVYLNTMFGILWISVFYGVLLFFGSIMITSMCCPEQFLQMVLMGNLHITGALLVMMEVRRWLKRAKRISQQ